MAKKPTQVQDGWARVDISRLDEDGEAHFSAAHEGKEVAHMWGRFYISVPVTVEAQAEAMKGAKTTFDTIDGTVVVEGPAGPAARKYYADALEPVRGELRKMAVAGMTPTRDAFQAMLDAAEPYNGRGGVRKPKVITGDQLRKAANMTVEELTAFMAAQGFTVTG